MSVPLVSIVIPCYNAERWVAAAIDSALAQTHPSLEVVVVDDGSTDQSRQVLESFGQKIRWESGPNRGGCAARNRGLELAKGEWIQFLDADDMLTPTAVADKLAFAATIEGIPCSAVASLDDSRHATIPIYWRQDRYSFETLVALGAPQTAAPLHRRQDLERVGGFRPGLPCAQEYDLHLRLNLATGRDFVSNRSIGVLIRPTPGSVSRKAGLRMASTTADVLLNAASTGVAKDDRGAEREALIAQRVIALARKHWRAGETEKARRLASAAQNLSSDWNANFAYSSRAASHCAKLVGFAAFEQIHGLWRRLTGRKPDPSESGPSQNS